MLRPPRVKMLLNSRLRQKLAALGEARFSAGAGLDFRAGLLGRCLAIFLPSDRIIVFAGPMSTPTILAKTKPHSIRVADRLSPDPGQMTESVQTRQAPNGSLL